MYLLFQCSEMVIYDKKEKKRKKKRKRNLDDGVESF